MARRRTPRRRTAEAEQYQLYTAFLSDPDNTNKKALSPTSINDYAKAVSAGRKLTELLQREDITHTLRFPKAVIKDVPTAVFRISEVHTGAYRWSNWLKRLNIWRITELRN